MSNSKLVNYTKPRNAAQRAKIAELRNEVQSAEGGPA